MQEMIEELQNLAAEAPDFTPRALKNPDNKWLVRSAFQKAIRRGELDRALRCGEYLIAADPPYAWQALATVVIEDVGFGDLDLVAYSTMTTLKTVREAMHSEFLFASMIQRACEAPKSRSCCELDLGVNMRLQVEGSAEQANQNMMQDWPDEAVHAAMVVPGQDIGGLAAAHLACRVARKRLRGKGEDALLPTLQMIMESLDDPSEQRAAMLSYERTVDSMNIALFPILRWLNALDLPIEEVDEKPEWPPEEVIMSVSSAAFDMHTFHGKKAIKAFWTSLKQDYDFPKLIDADRAVKAIGSLIFIVEGGLLDRRLLHDELRKLKKYQDLNFALGYGMHPSIAEEKGLLENWLNIIRNEIPRLNDKRKWAAST